MLPALPAVGIPVVSGQLFHCLFGYLRMYLIIWQRGIKKGQWSTLGGSIGTRDRALSTWCFVFAVVNSSPPPVDFIPRSSSLVGYASAESTPASPPPKVTLTPSTDGPLASASATREQCGTNDGTSVVVTSLEVRVCGLQAVSRGTFRLRKHQVGEFTLKYINERLIVLLYY
ncbi:hypothetical protein BKA61DRAFT_716050 [Leptodontidium sp. MPI-SDFR-AT-0119]|nr:hypothetical protein BKA61DRAFT_716050 [Leptodontidium sp. MPI-SDFR-AT-0119]